MAVSLALLACVLAGAHALPCRCPDAAPAEAVCGSDSLTYASACALRCARSPDRPDLAVAHKGACGRAGRSVETRDVMQLNECNEACEVAYSECLKKCTSGTCKERCAQDHLLNCNCQCKKFLNTRSSAALLAVLAAPNGRQTQQYAETTSPANVFIDCYNSVIDATTLCAKKCTSDACRQQCSAGWIEMVCKCNESPSTTSTPSSRGPSLESRVLVVVLTSLLGFVVGH